MKEKKKIQIVIEKARNLDEFPKHDMYANEYLWINREEKKHALTTQNEKKIVKIQSFTQCNWGHTISVWNLKVHIKKRFVDVCACGESGIFPKNFFLYILFDFFIVHQTYSIWPFSVLQQRRRNNFLKTK